MIIEFKVENFLSYKDLTTLSMVTAKSFKEHKDTHTFAIDNKLSLLKSSVIYGNNASGKSATSCVLGVSVFCSRLSKNHHHHLGNSTRCVLLLAAFPRKLPRICLRASRVPSSPRHPLVSMRGD